MRKPVVRRKRTLPVSELVSAHALMMLLEGSPVNMRVRVRSVSTHRKRQTCAPSARRGLTSRSCQTIGRSSFGTPPHASLRNSARSTLSLSKHRMNRCLLRTDLTLLLLATPAPAPIPGVTAPESTASTSPTWVYGLVSARAVVGMSGAGKGELVAISPSPPIAMGSYAASKPGDMSPAR